jgi:hypothetical protein
MQREIVGKQVTENMHFLACQLIVEPPVPLARMKKKGHNVCLIHIPVLKVSNVGTPTRELIVFFFLL